MGLLIGCVVICWFSFRWKFIFGCFEMPQITRPVACVEALKHTLKCCAHLLLFFHSMMFACVVKTVDNDMLAHFKNLMDS